MEISVRGIRDAGNIAEERVVIDVVHDVNIGDYILFFVRDIDEDKFSTKMISPIWFPEQELKAGDLVVVYTRSGGDRNKKDLDDGARTHFFYRNCDVPLCADENISVVSIKISDWVYSKKRL